jgi:hypothetical protein
MMSHAVDVTCVVRWYERAVMHNYGMKSSSPRRLHNNCHDSHCPEAPGPSWCRSCTTCEKCKVRPASHTLRELHIVQTHKQVASTHMLP